MRKLSEFPAYQTKREQLDRLHSGLKELRIERESIATQIRAKSKSDPVEALLRDESFVDTTALSTQLQENDRLISVHEQAIEIARRELRDLVGQLSLEICDSLRPIVQAHVQKIIPCLQQIAAQNRAIIALRNELIEQDIVIGYLPLATFGRVSESAVEQYVKEMREAFGV